MCFSLADHPLAVLLAVTVFLTAACSPSAPPAAAASPPASSAAAAPAYSGPMSKLAISYPEGGAHLPLFYARDKGIFAKNGLEVTLNGLGGGPVAAAALQAGEIQIADITGSEVVGANAAGADILILATLTPVYPYVFEVSKGITSPNDLKGKIIVVRAIGDATDSATRVLLAKVGFDPDKDVTILTVQQEGARMASLNSGQVCCTVAQVQDRLLLEKNGFHMLWDMTNLGIPNAQGVIAVQRAYAKANPEVVQRFMDSLVESIARAKKDKPGALPVLKAQLRLEDDAIVAATYDFLIGEVVPSVPTAKAEQFAEGILVMAKQNEKVKGFDVAPFIDGSFLEKSVAKGLDKAQ